MDWIELALNPIGIFFLTLFLHLLFADSEFRSKAPHQNTKAALMLIC